MFHKIDSDKDKSADKRDMAWAKPAFSDNILLQKVVSPTTLTLFR